MKLQKIVDLVGGTLQGDAAQEISGANGVELAQAGDITYFTDKQLKEKLETCKASAVIVSEPLELNITQVIHPNPPLAFAKILAEVHPNPRPEPGISPEAVVSENVTLGKNVTVSPFVYLGKNVSVGDDTVIRPGTVVYDGCRIGNQVTLHANVTLYHDTVIGNRVILHAGVVVGVDGFGYIPDEQGHHFKINQVGRVVIEDDVEVGSNVCIDRAAFGETVVKTGVKIDNLVQVAHNCEIGEHSLLVAQVGVAGSCKLGHHVILAGQVGVADHVTLGDQVILAAQSGVHKSLAKPGMYGGSPAAPAISWKRSVSVFSKLPELSRKIRELEKRLKAIENQ